MIIALDFDGTCVSHAYPKVGGDVPNCINVLKKLVECGHNLILYTMRCDSELTDAVEWFNKKDIPLYGIQKNPTQDTWTKSPKCYAEMYIDDAALGCPLSYPGENTRPYVDWYKVEIILRAKNIII